MSLRTCLGVLCSRFDNMHKTALRTLEKTILCSILQKGPMIFSRNFSSDTRKEGDNEQIPSCQTQTSEKDFEKDSLPFDQIPGPNWLYNRPLIGCLLHFKPFTNYTVKNVQVYQDSLFENDTPIVRQNMRGPTVLVSDAKDVECVFRNEGKYPFRPGVEIDVICSNRNNIKAKGILAVQGEEWHHGRTVLNKRLRKPHALSGYLEAEDQVTEDFVASLTSEKMSPEDIQELFFRFGVEATGVFCFNCRLGFIGNISNDPEKADLLNATKLYFKYIAKSHERIHGLLLKYYTTKLYRDFEWAKLTVRRNVTNRVQKAKENLEIQNNDDIMDINDNNILFSLISDDSLTLDEVVSTIETLFFGGSESVQYNLQILFYNLAKNPDKQEKLREEISTVLGKDGPLTKEALGNLSYLSACLRESFRLVTPTLYGMLRILPTDVVLSGYRVPAGTAIAAYNRKLHRAYFPEPDTFLPERWIRGPDGLREVAIPRTAYIPFGLGVRKCPGQQFAEQRIYQATAKVLQRLRVGLEPGGPETEFTWDLIFASPVKPINFTFRKLV